MIVTADALARLPADLPAPADDGTAAHLPGRRLPALALPATSGRAVDLAALGARVYGVSTQPGAEQREAAERLHLPFELLSDAGRAWAGALGLPTFEAGGWRLLRRLTLIARAGRVVHVMYPVFPPDRNAADVVAWLADRPGGAGAPGA